jgi:CheY-like chemotaxis protein
VLDPGGVKPGRRILITDDEPLFRTSAAESLRGRFPGVEVLEAGHGNEALERLERTPIDVLVTDLQMPELGGIELIARVSSHRMPIQIIVVSAFITEQTRANLDELGALVYIDKPIDLGALHLAVERMLAVPRAHVSGVTLAGFVQLLEVEQQTCALRVASPDGVGTLVFERGVLTDAWTGELAGDPAALAVLRFRDCTLDLVGVLRSENPRVTQPLSFLLLESARRADEAVVEPVAGQWELLSLIPPPPDSDAFAPTPTPLAPAPAQEDASAPAAMPPSNEGSALEPPPAHRRSLGPGGPASLLRDVIEIEGAMAVALVDGARRIALGSAGSAANLDLESLAVSATDLLASERALLDRLGVSTGIEEIQVDSQSHIHLIRPLEIRSSDPDSPGTFLFLVADRARVNIGLARRQLTKIFGGVAAPPLTPRPATG